MKLLSLFVLLLQGCSAATFVFTPGINDRRVPEGMSPGDIGGGSSASAPLLNIAAIDDNNEELGNVIYATGSIIIVSNSSGFIYSLYWDGSLVQSHTYYTVGGCTGDAYFYPSNASYTEKYVHVDGNGDLYTAFSSTLGVADSTSISVASRLDNTGTCASWGGSGSYVKVSTITRSALGIPNTIQSPITLEEN